MNQSAASGSSNNVKCEKWTPVRCPTKPEWLQWSCHGHRSNRKQIWLNRTICQCSVISLVKGSFLFAFVGSMAVQSSVLHFHILLVIHCGDLQAVPTPNGTSFDFVTTENGPVCRDLYSTPQYRLDQQDDCTGELWFPAVPGLPDLPLPCQGDSEEKTF